MFIFIIVWILYTLLIYCIKWDRQGKILTGAVQVSREQTKPPNLSESELLVYPLPPYLFDRIILALLLANASAT